ncbi:MAG: hypothetical protein ACHQ0J_03765 [Candidatus Dormibacterales bacterium]
MANEDTDLADAYWGRSEAAHNRVENAIRAGGRAAVLLLEQLAAAAPDEAALCSLGAGPLEDLVRWEGVALADELDSALERQPKLRVALRCVRVGVETLDSDISFRKFYGVPDQ